jgi:hypothetical protein
VRAAGNVHTGREIERTGGGYWVHMLQVLRVYAEAEAASNEGAWGWESSMGVATSEPSRAQWGRY